MYGGVQLPLRTVRHLTAMFSVHGVNFSDGTVLGKVLGLPQSTCTDVERVGEAKIMEYPAQQGLRGK